MTGPFGLRKRPLRLAVGTLVIVLVSVTFVPAVWHGEHALGKDCSVCKLGSQPLAESSSALELGPADAPEPAVLAERVVRLAERHLARSLGRAPPS